MLRKRDRFSFIEPWIKPWIIPARDSHASEYLSSSFNGKAQHRKSIRFYDALYDLVNSGMKSDDREGFTEFCERWQCSESNMITHMRATCQRVRLYIAIKDR